MKTLRTHPISELRRLLRYEHESGELFWTGAPWAGSNCHASAGARAGNENTGTKNIYRHIGVGRHRYYEHRVAFAMYHGRWPNGPIDHIDGDGRNNAIVNLRESSSVDNGRNSKLKSNNTSGINGVYWSTESKRWVAKIKVGVGSISLGYFKSKGDAALAREAANRKYGYHLGHGLTEKERKSVGQRQTAQDNCTGRALAYVGRQTKEYVMKKWKRRLINDFKAGNTIIKLASKYMNNLDEVYFIDRKIAVETIIRDGMLKCGRK